MVFVQLTCHLYLFSSFAAHPSTLWAGLGPQKYLSLSLYYGEFLANHIDQIGDLRQYIDLNIFDNPTLEFSKRFDLSYQFQ